MKVTLGSKNCVFGTMEFVGSLFCYSLVSPVYKHLNHEHLYNSVIYYSPQLDLQRKMQLQGINSQAVPGSKDKFGSLP